MANTASVTCARICAPRSRLLPMVSSAAAGAASGSLPRGNILAAVMSSSPALRAISASDFITGADAQEKQSLIRMISIPRLPTRVANVAAKPSLGSQVASESGASATKTWLAVFRIHNARGAVRARIAPVPSSGASMKVAVTKASASVTGNAAILVKPVARGAAHATNAPRSSKPAPIPSCAFKRSMGRPPRAASALPIRSIANCKSSLAPLTLGITSAPAASAGTRRSESSSAPAKVAAETHRTASTAERRGRRQSEIRCMRSGYGLHSQGLLDRLAKFFAGWLHA